MSVMMADGMPLAGIGSIITPHLSFSHFYYIPYLIVNLVFVGLLCDSWLLKYFFFLLLFVLCKILNPRS